MCSAKCRMISDITGADKTQGYKMSQNRKTAADKECGKFAQEVNEYMFREHGFQYLKPNEHKGEWRQKIPYTPEIEAELIKFAACYINMRVSNPQLAKLPTFLTKLVSLMADYLAKYIVKNPEYKCRDQATRALTETLTKKSRILTPVVLDDETRKKRDRIIADQARCKHRQVISLFDSFGLSVRCEQYSYKR